MSVLRFHGPADLANLTGGSVQSQSSTQFSYISANAVLVTVTGTALTYDGSGHLTGGVIGGLTMGSPLTPVASWTGLNLAATTYQQLAFTAPDPVALETTLMAGADNVFGGDGDGFLHGHAGNDTLHGGNGDDWMFGGSGRDTYYGDQGTDRVSFLDSVLPGQGVYVNLTLAAGQVRNDGYGNVESATSVEWWEGSDQNDTILGGASWETIWGAAGDDSLRGGGDSDWLYGEAGNDSLYGDGGVDILFGGTGTDFYDGGAEGDVLAMWLQGGTSTGARIDLRLAAGNIVNDGFGNTETAVNLENFEGTQLNDWMHAGNLFGVQPDVLRGMAGNDTLLGGNAWSALNGNDGDDSITGGAGNESISGGAGRDSLQGGAGVDLLDLWLDGFAGHGVVVNIGKASGQIADDGYGNVENATQFENISGSNHNDVLTGNSRSNLIYGNEGNDAVLGAAGDDLLHGGAGNDTLTGGDGSDAIWGEDGVNRLAGGIGADQFYITHNAQAALPERQVLTDFVHGVDMFVLDMDFGGFASAGALVQAQFRSGQGAKLATTADERLTYDTTTGNLYFDRDGNGTGFASVLIAQFSNHAALTYTDFAVNFI